MPDKIICDAAVKKAVVDLGKLIKHCHVGTSQAEIARRIDVPRSTLMYIENGQNAPSPKVYQNLVDALKPNKSNRRKMDQLFMQIRKTPPPDVCQVLIEDEHLIDIVRASNRIKLTEDQYQRMLDLMSSFTVQEEEGAAIHE